MKKIYQWFDKHVFNHVGREIQKYAILSLIVDVIAVIIGGILTMDDIGPISLILAPSIGLGYALLIAYPIYAFGQLVEDIHKTQENTRPPATDINELPEL